MNVSVILCTYNRCQVLRRALESVAASVVPESMTWEVLVVDNNSKDQTREVVEEFCLKYPGRFVYRFEPRQGKSFALNTAIHEARGMCLAFMDDDVIVASDWLGNITKPLASGEWVGAGGRIRAQQTFEAPNWLAMDGDYSLACMLALFDPGDNGAELKSPPIGANMAYRKSVFEKHGGFRTDMGPRPGSELRNEDTEFGRRVLAAGERLWYEPSAIVYHEVAQNRLTKQYFLRFWYDDGRASIREFANRKSVFGIPRWCFSIPLILLIPLPIKTFVWLSEREPKRRFYMKGAVWKTLGQIVELPQIWLEDKVRRRRDVRKGGSSGRSSMGAQAAAESARNRSSN